MVVRMVVTYPVVTVACMTLPSGQLAGSPSIP